MRYFFVSIFHHNKLIVLFVLYAFIDWSRYIFVMKIITLNTIQFKIQIKSLKGRVKGLKNIEKMYIL